MGELEAELKATPGVANVIAYTAASAQDVSGQLQQFQSLIQQHVDLIVTLAASGPAFIPAIQQAAAAGIPTVSLVNDIESPDSVNISPNTWQDVAAPVTSILNGIGKKGNVLEVHGIPGTQTDTDTFTDFGDLLAPCPGISVLGAVDGDYSPPAVESAVLQFLSTNPAPVAAVLQTATMAPYVMEAFQKAGRPIPPVVDVGAQEGSLAYWSENRKTYHGGATVGGDLALANEAVRVVRRMLVGQGVKVNNIIWYQPVVTTANLSKFVQPSWALTTQGTVEDPPSTYVTNAELNALFNHPKIKVTAP
jgi:ribose transport system substrate-binding protein